MQCEAARLEVNMLNWKRDLVLRRNRARADKVECLRRGAVANEEGRWGDAILHCAVAKDYSRDEAELNRDLLAMGIKPGEDKM